MTTFDPPTKSDAVVLREFFRRDGQTLDQFHEELKAGAGRQAGVGRAGAGGAGRVIAKDVQAVLNSARRWLEAAEADDADAMAEADEDLHQCMEEAQR